jgi:hypothetical protein
MGVAKRRRGNRMGDASLLSQPTEALPYTCRIERVPGSSAEEGCALKVWKSDTKLDPPFDHVSRIGFKVYAAARPPACGDCFDGGSKGVKGADGELHGFADPKTALKQGQYESTVTSPVEALARTGIQQSPHLDPIKHLSVVLGREPTSTSAEQRNCGHRWPHAGRGVGPDDADQVEKLPI